MGVLRVSYRDLIIHEAYTWVLIARLEVQKTHEVLQKQSCEFKAFGEKFHVKKALVEHLKSLKVWGVLQEQNQMSKRCGETREMSQRGTQLVQAREVTKFDIH